MSTMDIDDTAGRIIEDRQVTGNGLANSLQLAGDIPANFNAAGLVAAGAVVGQVAHVYHVWAHNISAAPTVATVFQGHGGPGAWVQDRVLHTFVLAVNGVAEDPADPDPQHAIIRLEPWLGAGPAVFGNQIGCYDNSGGGDAEVLVRRVDRDG